MPLAAASLGNKIVKVELEPIWNRGGGTEVGAQEVHQEEACEDQAVQVDHLNPRYLNVLTLQERKIQPKNANNDRKYVEYSLYEVYAKYGNGCDVQNMQNMTDMHNKIDMSGMI